MFILVCPEPQEVLPKEEPVRLGLDLTGTEQDFMSTELRASCGQARPTSARWCVKRREKRTMGSPVS